MKWAPVSAFCSNTVCSGGLPKVGRPDAGSRLSAYKARYLEGTTVILVRLIGFWPVCGELTGPCGDLNLATAVRIGST